MFYRMQTAKYRKPIASRPGWIIPELGLSIVISRRPEGLSTFLQLIKKPWQHFTSSAGKKGSFLLWNLHMQSRTCSKKKKDFLQGISSSSICQDGETRTWNR